MGWEKRDRDMSIQVYPSQSIVKTVQPLLSNHQPNTSGATSPTPGYSSSETVLTLIRMTLRDGGGAFR